MTQLGPAHTRRVQNHQHGAVAQRGRAVEQARDLLRTEYTR
jgi:hypothetical protein